MMKSNRKTIVLLVLFFGGLLTMWGLDVEPASARSRERAPAPDRVLPDLIDTPEAEIRRVAIDRGEEHLVFERRGKGPGRWQMVEPKDVAAEPSRLEALVRNLKELREVARCGHDRGRGGDVRAGAAGRDGPALRRRRQGRRLRVGRSAGRRAGGRQGRAAAVRYVRPAGGAGIEVVDARLLAAVDLPVADWREPNVMGVPTFQVASVTITRRDEPGRQPRVIRAERGRSGRWKLDRRRSKAPANGPKIESLLGGARVAPRGRAAQGLRRRRRQGLHPVRPGQAADHASS